MARFPVSIRSTQRLAWATAVGIATLGLAAAANAQTSADDMARRHFESGAAYLEQAEYEDALREFEKSFELSGRPEVLLNVATVHERLGNLDAAIEALERYLALAPEGQHAETVTIRLQNLRQRRASQPEPEAAEAEPKPEAQPAPAERPEAPPEPEPASPSRLPSYILFGVAGASAIGAVVTGVVSSSEHSSAEESCSPSCSDDELSTGRTMAWTSTVLTGVAVVAAGVGVALLFTGDDTPERQARTWSFDVGAGPDGAMAQTRWRF